MNKKILYLLFAILVSALILLLGKSVGVVNENFPLFEVTAIFNLVILGVYIFLFEPDIKHYSIIILITSVIPLSHSIGWTYQGIQKLILFVPLILLLALFFYKKEALVIKKFSLNKQKTNFILILFFLILVMKLAFIVFWSFHNYPVDMGTSTLSASANFLTGINPYAVPETMVEGHDRYIHQQNFMYPPFMFIGYSGLLLMLGVSIFGWFLANLVLDAAIILLIFFVVKKLVGESAAIVSALIYALNPSVLFEIIGRGTNETLPLFFVVLGVLLLINNKVYLSILSISLATLSKWFPAVFILPILIYLFNKKDLTKLVKVMFLGTIIALLVLLPFFFMSQTDFVHDMTWENQRPVEGWETQLSLQYFAFNTYYFFVHIGIVLLMFLSLFKKIKSINDVLIAGTTGILLFIIFGKIFHTHYILWFLPWVVLSTFLKSDLTLAKSNFMNKYKRS